MADDEIDYAARDRVNRLVAIAVVIVIALGVLVAWAMDRSEKLQDCVAAGHHDCEPVDQGQ
jgi:hypothetical protein